jgi:hypothetical protein
MKCGHRISEVEFDEVTERVRYICIEGHVTEWQIVNANEMEIDDWYLED